MTNAQSYAALADELADMGYDRCIPLRISLPGSGVICACAGHRIPDAQFLDKEAAATAYRELYRDRTHGMTLYRSTFVSLAEQWKSNGDLVSSESMVAASLEYDLKHRPIKVHDHNGLIRFDTTPWDNIQEFLRYRNARVSPPRRPRRCPTFSTRLSPPRIPAPPPL